MKLLTAEKTGENGVGDLMFIEGRNVDVATKLIMGYAMRDKTYTERWFELSSMSASSIGC